MEPQSDRGQSERIEKEFPPIDDFRSLNWWVRQFTETQNCAPGGVCLIFGGLLSLCPPAAAWYVAASGMKTVEGNRAFPEIFHIVPASTKRRDARQEICDNVKALLAQEGEGSLAQNQIAEACSSACFVGMSASKILTKLKTVPEGSAVAIMYAERVRYADVETLRENVLTTHTGIRIQFSSEERLAIPHLYKLVEDLLAIAATRNLAMIVFTRLVPSEVPERILQAKHLAIFHGEVTGGSADDLKHYVAAEQIFDTQGIQAARSYVENNIPDPANRALIMSDFLGREKRFSAAWQELLPQLSQIRSNFGARSLLNVAQAAAAAGAAQEASAILRDAWEIGMDQLESLTSAALLAQQLHLSPLRDEVVATMISNFSDHPSTAAREYELLTDHGDYVGAASVARRCGKEFEAGWCELNSAQNPDWKKFLDLGIRTGRFDQALAWTTSLALQRGDLNLARNFINRIERTPKSAAVRAGLLIELANKELATAQEDDLESIDRLLDEVFHYVGNSPNDSETRLDLVELFETSLPDTITIILLAKRCSDTFVRWQNGAPNDAVELEKEILSSLKSGESLDEAHSFMKALYDEGKPNIIGRGNVPASFEGRIDNDLLMELGHLLHFAGHQSDTRVMTEILHGICIVCCSLGNPHSDYVAGLHAMGILVQVGKVQEALNLGETMLCFWPAAQRKSETARKAHGWAAMSDAYLRAQNPATSLLHLCLSFEAMTASNVQQPLVLFRHKLQLAIRLFRNLRMPRFGHGFLQMERQFVDLFPDNKSQRREFSVLELSCKLAELTDDTPAIVLQQLVDQCAELLRDESEVEWAPIVSSAASTFAECRRRGVPVSQETTKLLFVRLGRCPTRIQDLIRRHLLESPQLTDVEAAIRDLEDAARFDDQGFQLTVLEGFLRRAITAACDRGDCELFLAAATLLSQPAVAAVHARSLKTVGTRLKMRGYSPDEDGGDLPELLADYAAATHLESSTRHIRFSDSPLLPLSAIRHMAGLEETFCVLAYNSQRKLCQALISRDKVEGPKVLPETMWSAAKHRKWSRCLPDHYAWKVQTDYGSLEERPKLEAVKTSLRNLSIDVPPEVRLLTFVPEAELFGFPFIITDSRSVYLGERVACSTAASLPWLASIRRAHSQFGGRLEGWLGSPSRSPFDVLKVRDDIMPIIQSSGGRVHNTDTPEPLENADLAVILSHGGHGFARSFAGIPEEFGRFTTDDLADWLGRCQCVILFVCHAGRSDDRLYNQETFGLVSRLLRRRVRLVIAPPWPLNTDIPSAWLPPFLSALKIGNSAGMASDFAAQAVRSKFAHPCAWGAMQLFGDLEYHFVTREKTASIDARDVSEVRRGVTL